MAVAVLITDVQEAEGLLPWAVQLAKIRKASLLVVVPQKDQKKGDWLVLDESSDSKVGQAVFAVLEKCLQTNPERPAIDQDSDGGVEPIQIENGETQTDSRPDDEPHFLPQVEVKQFSDSNPGSALVDEFNQISVSLLILPAAIPTKNDTTEPWQNVLYRNAPCNTMLLQDDGSAQTESPKVLVIVTDDQDDSTALRIGTELATFRNGSLTAAFVEPDIDDLAPLVGRRVLDKIIKASYQPRQEEITRQVVVANSLRKGLEKIEPDDFEIVLVGTRVPKQIRSVLTAKLGQEGRAAPARVLVRKGRSFQNRVIQSIRNAIERIVPQLNRSQRVSLVERIQSSSKWNFDFVSLIFLSTLIAALGLVQNSAAVVIGAMLVAPLMTPIVGIGLGIAQSNIRLIRDASRTVFYGFATALFVGIVVGLVASPEISNEMRARENPGFVDLIIALTSGIAAAYAMGRPNLVSALPGVAIAAALVPPVATAGIAISQLEGHLAVGALLLFSTNIVAITLGTAFTFWCIGLTQYKKDGKPAPSWPRWIFLGLVIASLVLTALMTMNRISPAGQMETMIQGVL